MVDTAQDKETTLLFHAEVDDRDGQPTPTISSDDSTVYSTFLGSRPERFEVDAISRIINLQKEFPTLRCHIVHLSAAQALPIIRSAKAAGHKLTVETCFHYLCLASDSIPDGRPEFKCCPPIRDATNREALWAALLDGTIDCVVSDHSPCVAELKNLDQGDIMGAWGGISTLGFGLSLLWTEARKRDVPIGTILRWVSENTANHAGLGDTKGKIAVGYDADLVIWDPDTQYIVSAASASDFSKAMPMVVDYETRSRRKWFSSRIKSLHTKAWCSPDRWSRRYFAGVRSTTGYRIRSLTWSHREHFCEDSHNPWDDGSRRSQLSCQRVVVIVTVHLRPVIKSQDVMYDRMERNRCLSRGTYTSISVQRMNRSSPTHHPSGPTRPITSTLSLLLALLLFHPSSCRGSGCTRRFRTRCSLRLRS